MAVKKGKLMMLALTASLSAAGLWGCRGEAVYLTGGQAQSAEESGTEETSEDEIAAGGTSEEGRLHIVIRDVRTALYRITDFVYDGEQDGFEGQAVIDREGINYWGTVTGQ